MACWLCGSSTVDDGEVEGADAEAQAQALAAAASANAAKAAAAAQEEGNLHRLLDLAKNPQADWGEIFAELAVHPELAEARPSCRRYSLLHHAAYAGNLTAVRRLLFEYAVPPGLLSGAGETAEEIAQASGFNEVADLLRAALKNAARLVEGWAANAIHDVLDMAKWGDWSSVLSALQAEPGLAAARPRVRRFALLHHAAFWGNVEVVQELLETYSVPPGQLTKDGKTAIEVAREPLAQQQERGQWRDPAKCEEVVRLLLGVQEDQLHQLLSQARDCGNLPETWASIFAQLEQCPGLALAPTPAARKFGLLHHAAHWGNLEAVQTLVRKYYVSPLLRTKDGEHAAEVARKQGHEAVAAFLRRSEKGTPAASSSLTFKELCAQSRSLIYFRENGVPVANRIALLKGMEQTEAEEDAASTRPVLHVSAQPLFAEFIKLMQAGTPQEQAAYAGLTVQTLAARFIRCRPLMFMTGVDEYLLPSGESGIGWKDFDAIGTASERPPLVMQDYLSYDEMLLSALLGTSTPVHFINRGARGNKGKPEQKGTFERRGVYLGQVGARFERPGLMEWQHLVVDNLQNTLENGYGANAPAGRGREFLRLWARWYGLEYFPTYAEAFDQTLDIPGYGKTKSLKVPRFVEVDKYGSHLDLELYYRRMRVIAETFLLDAQARAAEKGTTAFCHVVGLGIGVWSLATQEQACVIVQTYIDAIASIALPKVSDLCFSWFPHLKAEWLHSCTPFAGNSVTLTVSKRDPAEKLTGDHAGKLLVAQYAWDANAYPGNEYWLGLLAASGDPAAACCSTIPELQNPQVNTPFPDRLYIHSPS